MGNLLQNQVQPTGTNTVVGSDLPAWYQTATQNLGKQSIDLAQNLNNQPLPAASVAGFNPDQIAAFNSVREGQGMWEPYMAGAMSANNETMPTAAKFIDYAQGAVGAPAMTTADSVQPWAQGAQDAASGSAQDWTKRFSEYMSPYTGAVVDNIARLGKRNFEEDIMPGIQSSMIGSGQFGSTRNADILSRAGVRAADDITGQQAQALERGYGTSANIFAGDANRAQQQQRMQADTAMSGGQLIQGALSADANRIQNQGQMQAQTALSGATGAVNAINAGADNMGALAQTYQTLRNTDAQSLLNIGNQQQKLQQTGYDVALDNANTARTDPWAQIKNAQGVIGGTQLPKTQTTATSGIGGYSNSPIMGALQAYALSQGMPT